VMNRIEEHAARLRVSLGRPAGSSGEL